MGAKALDAGEGVDGDMAQVVLDELYNWVPTISVSRNSKTIPDEMASRLYVALETYVAICEEVDAYGTGD